MGNVTKDEALYQEMCRVVGKVVLEMRDLGQEPKHIVIAGVLRTALANQRVKRSELTTKAMETVVKALAANSPALREQLKRAAEQVIDHTREDKNGRRVNLHPVVDLSRHRGQFRNVHDKRQRRILQQADKNPHQRRQNISAPAAAARATAFAAY